MKRKAATEEQALRAKARDVLDTGKLPNRRPDRVWGEPGAGAPCTVCDLPVPHDQVEFELEFARAGDDPGLDKHHVHIRCFAAWESERMRNSPMFVTARLGVAPTP